MMTKMTSRPEDILAALDIEVIGRHRHRGDMQTCALDTIASILRTHGDEHCVITLRSIVESAGNEGALTEKVIRAMSAVILAKPEWAGTGLRWIEVLDNLDLMAMSDRAKPFYQGADVLAGMITEAVRKEFEPPNAKPVPLSRSIIRLCPVAPRQ